MGPKAEKLREMREAKAKQSKVKPHVTAKVLADKVRIKSIGKMSDVKASKRP